MKMGAGYVITNVNQFVVPNHELGKPDIVNWKLAKGNRDFTESFDSFDYLGH